MLLSILLKNVDYKSNISDKEISGITCDSRQIEKDNVFVCIKGEKYDGYMYAKEMSLIAAAIVTEIDMGLANQIIVSNTRKAYGIICGNYFKNPNEKLKIIAVTGTNGKSTCTFLIKQILENCGKKVGLMGTIHNEMNGIILPTKNTTPDSYSLQSMLHKMVKLNCEYVIMEASSHALDQYRLAGIKFKIGVFTNLTVDHLDYHKTMENYYLAKKKLFENSEIAVINYDDEYGKRLKNEFSHKAFTFSVDDENADYTAKNIKSYIGGSTFDVKEKDIITQMKTTIPGDYSVSNAMAVIVVLIKLGFNTMEIADGLKKSVGVLGRMEVLYNDDFTIIRDYAHTPDALEKVLTTIKKYKENRLIVLFGCAGCRDRKKRKLMGKIVMDNADFAILTSDNPREESEIQIVNDTIIGMNDENKYKIITDRYMAIKWAMENIQKGDILILAGKGHENYQVLSDGTVYFNEKEIVNSFLL